MNNDGEDLCNSLIRLIDNNQLENAYYLSKAAIKKNIKNPNFLEIYGIILIKLDKKNEAIDILKCALKIKPSDLRIKYNIAKIYYELNDYKFSLRYLIEIKNFYSNNLQYWEMLGACYSKLEKFDVAIESFSKALSIDKNNFNSIINLGILSRIIKNYNNSFFYLENAIQLKSNSFEAWFNLALSHQEVGNFSNAINCYKKALEINPTHAEAYTNIGLAFHELKQYNEALQCYEHAIKLNPYLHLAHYNNGLSFHALKNYSKAVECYSKALEVNPNHAESYSNLGLTFYESKNSILALQYFEKAIKLDSKLLLAHYNKGLTLFRLMKYDAAISCFKHVLNFSPLHKESLLSIGSIYSETKFFENAIKIYSDLIKSDPNYAEAHHNLALLLLGLFRFSEGWLEYEWRWSVSECNSSYLQTSKKLWDGKPSSSRIFIWAEQGIGDQILYASALADLINFPNKKIISVHQKLLPLFKRSFPEFEVIPDNLALSESQYDKHLPIASLPKFFRNSLADFEKQRYPYLIPDSSKLSIAQLQQLPQGLVCGISWRSSNEKVGEEKSMPLALLEPILKLPGLVPVNLQYGDVEEEITAANRETGSSIIQIQDLNVYDDIDGLLALIDRCDIVVTTSNSTAHLAGAIGKETYLIAPTARGKFWYWHDLEGISLWYPSIKIFKQTAPGDWSHPIQKIASIIRNKIEGC